MDFQKKTRLPLKMHPLLLLCAGIFFAVLAACSTQETPSGMVASINDVSISYSDLEGRRTALFPFSTGDITKVKDSKLQEQYSYALRQLINEELVFQHMQQKNILPGKSDLDKQEDLLTAGLSAKDLSELLDEEGISLEEWRKRIGRQLVIELFMQQILRPEITISADQVTTYYETHKDDFFVPEQWHFLQITSPHRNELETAKVTYTLSHNATLMQKNHNVTTRDIFLDTERLPKPVIKELSSLQPGEISREYKEGKEYTFFVLLDNIPARPMNVVEVNDKAVQALVEDQLQKAYVQWLAKKMARSTIQIHDALLRETVLASDSSNGTRKDAPSLPCNLETKKL